MLIICEHIIRVDDYIIKIDYNTNIQKIGKYVIYESLKDSGSISKTKNEK